MLYNTMECVNICFITLTKADLTIFFEMGKHKT